MSLQSIIALAFLERYGVLHAMPCPTVRGSTYETAVRYLPSFTTIEEVYKNYTDQCFLISASVFHAYSRGSKQLPVDPLLQRSFRRVWRDRVPTLRIFRRGNNFCDT